MLSFTLFTLHIVLDGFKKEITSKLSLLYKKLKHIHKHKLLMAPLLYCNHFLLLMF